MEATGDLSPEAETPAETAETATPEIENAAPAAETPAETPATVISDAPIDDRALVAEMDKDQLEAFARDRFQRELDKRRKLPALRDEVLALLDGSTQRDEAKAAAASQRAERRASSTPVRARHKTLRDKKTGELFEFEWNPLYARNADLEPIYEGDE